MPASLGFPRSALALALLAGGLACAPAPRPTLSLHLVAVPADFEEVNVHIREVQLEGSTGWTTIAVPNVTLNLVRLDPGGLTLAGKHQDLLVWRAAGGRVERRQSRATGRLGSAHHSLHEPG